MRFSSRADDIIQLNKKQKQIQGQKAALRRQGLGVRGRFTPGRRAGAAPHRGHYIVFTVTLKRRCGAGRVVLTRAVFRWLFFRRRREQAVQAARTGRHHGPGGEEGGPAERRQPLKPSQPEQTRRQPGSRQTRRSPPGTAAPASSRIRCDVPASARVTVTSAADVSFSPILENAAVRPSAQAPAGAGAEAAVRAAGRSESSGTLL